MNSSNYLNPMGNMGIGGEDLMLDPITFMPREEILPPMMGFGQNFKPPMEPHDMSIPMMRYDTQGRLPTKQPFLFDNITLFPPEPDFLMQQRQRERPLCCHTVFVGGLPPKVSEDDVREVFSKCGPINSLRFNKRHCAHIRFDTEDSVDHALYLSGYRMVLHMDGEPSIDRDYSGRIFVHYSDDREDQYLAECYKRQMAREMRHVMNQEAESNRPPSPKRVKPYSTYDMNTVIENIKAGGDKLSESVLKLTAWLERGDCTRATVNTFYGVIQSLNVQIRRLNADKTTLDTELQELKDKYRLTFEKIMEQMGQIDQLYASAMKQRSWDVFSKAQRKNLQAWHKQEQATFKLLEADYSKQFQSTEEMEMSDDDNGDEPPNKALRTGDSDLVELFELRQENRSLTSQVDAYRNEVDLLKHELATVEADRDSQIKSLQQAFHGMQQQLILAKQATNKIISSKSKDVDPLKDDVSQDPGESSEDHSKQVLNNEEIQNDVSVSTAIVSDFKPASASTSLVYEAVPAPASTTLIAEVQLATDITARDAKVIGLLSCFLNIHPLGANIDYIWSYFHQMDMELKIKEIEEILMRYPDIFPLEIRKIGTFQERCWRLAFWPQKSNKEPSTE